MPTWIEEILLGPSFALGQSIWNMTMALIYGVVTTTPQGFSSAAWQQTVTLYQWLRAIALTIMNIFFMVGFFRQASNIKENLTWEILIELGVKAVAANTLMLSGISLIQEFFSVAAELSGEILVSSPVSFAPGEIDAGVWLFFAVFEMIYVIVAIVCSFMILFSVYGRFLKLYVVTAISPVALATLPGGRGIENTAYAWIRYFLSCVFEIVIIAITLTIAGKMISAINFGQLDSTIGSWIDGFGQCLQSLFTMILMTAAVKGAGDVMRKGFGL